MTRCPRNGEKIKQNKRVWKAGSYEKYQWVNVVPGHSLKCQAVVYNNLPPTTAVTDYAIGLRKLPANGQFFIGAQMAVSL